MSLNDCSTTPNGNELGSDTTLAVFFSNSDLENYQQLYELITNNSSINEIKSIFNTNVDDLRKAIRYLRKISVFTSYSCQELDLNFAKVLQLNDLNNYFHMKTNNVFSDHLRWGYSYLF